MIKFERMWKSIKESKKQRRNIKEVNLKDINLNECIIIDVRSRREYKEEHLNASINIPFAELKKNIEKYVKDKNKRILVCCQSGIRSARAAEVLNNMGYINVYNLKGGLENI